MLETFGSISIEICMLVEDTHCKSVKQTENTRQKIKQENKMSDMIFGKRMHMFVIVCTVIYIEKWTSNFLTRGFTSNARYKENFENSTFIC